MQVATANRLSDGRVVYLATDGGWTARLDQARPAADPAAGEALLALAADAVAAQQIVEPYLIEIGDAGDAGSPKKFREAIRATGPSIDWGVTTPGLD